MISETPLYEAFFRKNTSYYLDRLERYRNGQKFTFNPFAFLFGFIWFTYRKMYMEAFLLLCFIVLVGFIETYLLENVFDADDGQIISWIMTLSVWTATGFIANYLYLRKAQKVVQSAVREQPDPDSAGDFVRRKGGTSYLFLLAVALVIIAFFISSNYILEQ